MIPKFRFKNFFGIIFSNSTQSCGNKFNIDGRRNFDGNHRIGIDHSNHIDKRLHIFNRITVVKRERRDDAAVAVLNDLLTGSDNILKINRIDGVPRVQVIRRLLNLPQHIFQLIGDLFGSLHLIDGRQAGSRHVFQRMIFFALNFLELLKQSFELFKVQLLDAFNAPHVGDQLIDLLRQNVPADSHFGALAIGNDNPPSLFDGLLGHAEQTRFQLRGHKRLIRIIHHDHKMKRLE